MAEAAGVAIPTGSADAIEGAGNAWKELSRILAAHGKNLGRAATAVVGADWHGDASAAYASISGAFSRSCAAGGGLCAHAGTTCHHFAHELRAAQKHARAARRDAEDAITRRDAAQRDLEAAESAIVAAGAAADAAAHNAAIAGAAGPAGASSLAAAHASGHQAAGALEAAEGAQRDARHRLHEAEADLRRARKTGEDANDEAEHAGRAAARALEDVASGYVFCVPLGPAPVPVSLRGARPEIAGALPRLGNPLTGAALYISPGEARAAQIATQRQAAINAAAAAKQHDGDLGDLFSGFVHGLTFDQVDLGGDHKSKLYGGGDLISNLPVSPAAIVKDTLKVGGKILLRREAKQVAKRAIKAAKPMKPITPIISAPRLRPPRLPEHPDVDIPVPSKAGLRPPPKVTAYRNPETGKYEIRTSDEAAPPKTHTGSDSGREGVHKAEDVKRESRPGGAVAAGVTDAVTHVASDLHHLYPTGHLPGVG